MPVPADPDRTRIEDDYTRGAYVDDDTVDITIKAGFNDKVETFEFKAVPLVTRGQ